MERIQYDRESERHKRHGWPVRRLSDTRRSLEAVLKKTAVAAPCERTKDVRSMERRLRRLIKQLQAEHDRLDRVYFPTSYRIGK